MAIDVSTTEVQTKKFEFVAGNLCLDFCNTVGGKRGGIAREYLNSYRDFVSWSEQAGLLDKSEAETLLRISARHPSEAQAVLDRAIALREAMYRLFFDVAQNKSPQKSDMAQLNDELARMLNRLRVIEQGEGFSWDWARNGESLDYPLGPIARSAAELLTSRGFGCHIHRCEGQNCGWLFIDSSKNHSRRWCDMRDCGNRAKVRRHRLKQAKTSSRKN